MKKIISLSLLLLVFAGCNKTERYEKELNGTWTAYNYILNNVTAFNQFQQTHQNYTLSFTSSGSFTESYTDDSMPVVNHGSYHFLSNDQIIALDDTLLIPVDSIVYDSIYERQYKLYDLTGNSTSGGMQLFNDSSDLYLQKAP